jgi:hypothetical protein
MNLRNSNGRGLSWSPFSRSGKQLMRRQASTTALVQRLDQRMMLTSSYTVPLFVPNTTTPVTAVTLKHKPNTTRDVEIFLNASGTAEPTVLSPSPTDSSISIHGQRSGLTLVDTVIANVKPTGGVNFDNSSAGVLEIDAGDDDTLMQVTASTATSATIEVTDTVNSALGVDKFGDGVTYLTLRTNDVQAMGYRANGGDGTDINVGTDRVNFPALNSATHLTIDTGIGTYDTINLGGLDTGESCWNATVLTGHGHDIVTLKDDDDDSTAATIDFGAGTGSGNGLGRGNQLNVWERSTGTLAHLGASTDPIVVDSVNLYTYNGVGGTLVEAAANASVQAPLTVTSQSPLTGTMTVNDGGTATFTGDSIPSSVETISLGGTVNVFAGANVSVDTLKVPIDQSHATVNAHDGSTLTVDLTNVYALGVLTFNLTSNADVSITSFNVPFDIDMNVGAVNVNDGGLLTVGTFAVDGTVNVNEGGDMTVLYASSIATLNVTGTGAHVLFKTSAGSREQDVSALTITIGGRVDMLSRYASPATTGAAARLLLVHTLNLGNSGPTGTLDVTDNDLIIDYDGASPIGTLSGTVYDGVTGLIQHGYNSGAWNQPGIISSQASGTYTTLGVAEASDVSSAIGGVFGGRTVDSTMVLVKFTYGGDANLDGKLNIDDYVLIDQGIAATLAGWSMGDFNYDGKINVDDYTTFLDSNIGNQGSQIL